MDEREMMRRWVQTWKEAGPELEAIRRREVEQADNRFAVLALDALFDYAVRSQPPRASSGLVEMQEMFKKLRR